jgi:hypothetical protein
MRIDWILNSLIHNPAAQYTLVALALALAVLLAVYVFLKREIGRLRRSVKENGEAATSTAATMTAELAVLRKNVETIEPISFQGQELNLTRRMQALRMRRRGELPSTIAAALRVPRNEIDLLLKIDALARQEQSADEPGRKSINAA